MSFAQPPPEIVEHLNASYSPVSKVTESNVGWSASGKCWRKKIVLSAKDPITGGASKIQAKIYLPKEFKDKKPPATLRTILILPPTGGENIIDRGYADTFCDKDFRTVILQIWDHDSDTELSLDMYDKRATRASVAIRRMTDYLDPKGNRRTGIFGTSLGALQGAFAIGFDKRLKTGVLIVGGIGMAEMIAYSDETRNAKLRDERMKAWGLKSTAQYLKLLNANINIEPGDFAGYSGGKNILAFVATKDSTVPTKNQWDLVDAYETEYKDLPKNHVNMVLHVSNYWKTAIVSYFEKHLPP